MHLLEQAAVFLLTAVLLVPLFQRLKLGAVLGYLGAGMLIGPFGLGMIGEVESTLQFAEFGVVLLLFLVGLELQPSRLWVLRRPVFGLGGTQVLATGAVLAALALAFGFSWQAALVAGFGLAMSSTALVLASLAERKQLATRHGREAFAVLLFQDVSVIPLLALLPLLSDSGTHAAGGWMAAVKGLAVIAVVIISSRIVVRPVLKAVASYGGREVFTAAALLLVVGAALIMEKIGLSASLGAFLAGVLLADSEFRHELEADIEPFKGLLLGLFFIAVGMSANLALLTERPLLVLALAAGLMLIKAILMYAIARIGGAPNDTAIAYIRANFASMRPSTRPSTASGRSQTRPRFALMPTAMKKRPSSRPLKGSMSASSSWRNSESARSTPARKAPSEGDRPIFSMISAAPTTSSSAAAVNTSRPP